MNTNVDSEEINCKLTMGTAAATVGHRAYIDQICVPQSMSTKTDEKLFKTITAPGLSATFEICLYVGRLLYLLGPV